MKVTHPLADRETEPPDAVAVAPGESYPVEDGVADLPDDVAKDVAKRWADHYGETEYGLPFDPSAHTNDEVAERVADIDEVEVLTALMNLEEQQQDRDGATSAISDRLDELEG